MMKSEVAYLRQTHNWLDTYFEYTARYSEAPEHFHRWVGVSTIASVLQRNVWFHMGSFNFFPNFYLILVAGPGVAVKSTSASVGKRLLQLADIHGVVFAPRSGTWQGIAQRMSRDTPQITVHASELGQLVKTDDGGMLTFFTDLWDGTDYWSHETRTQELIGIHEPWVNLIGCCTPAWIRDSFKDINVTGGFASRCCFVYGKEKSKLIPFPGEYTAERRPLEQALVRDLRSISRLRGAFKMEPEARALVETWYWDWFSRNAPKSEEEQGFHSRSQGHKLKLAMVVAVAKRDSLVITAEDIREADRMLETAVQGQGDVLSAMETPAARPQGMLVDFIARCGKVRISTLVTRFVKKIPAPEIRRMVDALASTGVVKVVREKNRQVVIYMGDRD